MRILLLLALYASVLTAFLSRSSIQSRVAIPAGARKNRATRVLVIGASGGTGQELVRQALERGCQVTAFVRDPSRLTIAHPQLTVVRGDVMDYVSVEAAMRGQEAVLCALGHRQYFRPVRTLSEGTRNILRAMEVHSVRRLVCETSLGIGDSVGRLGILYTMFTIPLILPFYFMDKVRQEQVIASSGVEWVVVRPGVLTNGEKRGTCHHGPRIGSYLKSVRISRADVADFMLNQMDDDAYLRTSTGISW